MGKFGKIYRKIRKFNKIVIARHTGADPDCLASSIALKESILKTFPRKEVYAIGMPATPFKFIGKNDKLTDDDFEKALLIIVDTPDRKRVDGINDIAKFKYSIKIDHHPFIEKICDYEWIDDTASSASQMVLELIYKTRLVIDKEIGEKLFAGIVADTNRFLFKYTSPKTFSLISKLVDKQKIEFNKVYEKLYLRPLKEKRLQGYILDNMIVTENGLGYLKITDDILKQYGVDASAPSNMVNEFNFIDEILVWTIFTEDKNNDTIKCSIRSRGPIINDVASRFNGGGHIYASGARFKSMDQTDDFIEALETVCKQYKETK